MPNAENVLKNLWAYAPPLIIESAVRNRVFDVLEASPKTVAETSAATGASQRGLASVMNSLVGMGLLTRDNAGRYSLTEDSSVFLVSSKPSSLAGMFRHVSSDLLPRWLQLSEVVRTGVPATHVNEMGEGSAFFTHLVPDLFAMNYPAACVAADTLGIAARQGPVRVLDLAAGSAVWSIAMAQRSPNVTVTAVDWPAVLEVTKGMVARMGLSDRYLFAPGDLATANFGTGQDIAILGHILHSEGVQRSRNLLARVYEAMAPGGTVVIGEFLVDADRRGPVSGLIFGVNMLVNTDTGNTYSFEEIREWLEVAGFANVGVVPAPAPSPLIFANKPFTA
jgi:SAM-dependent methyltransferase